MTSKIKPTKKKKINIVYLLGGRKAAGNIYLFRFIYIINISKLIVRYGQQDVYIHTSIA